MHNRILKNHILKQHITTRIYFEVYRIPLS